MTAIPRNAASMVSQVRSATRSRRNSQPNSAAKKGALLMTMSVLATVVCAMAKMKPTNMTVNRAPDTIPGVPTSRILRHVLPRCCCHSQPPRNSTMKTERQKVISQLSEICMLRTSTPALDQHSVAPTMNSNPRWWARAELFMLAVAGGRLRNVLRRA